MGTYSYNSSHPESGHSPPRSREIDFENSSPWEDQNYKVKFMCSYAGKIHPRPHDNQLSYVGGETKILAVDRNVEFSALLTKLIALCDCDAISCKYQLPGEDLDALISVTNDDDLEHMMHEYDRLCRISPKPARLRLFVFPNQNPALNSSGRKTDKERFVDALNNAPQSSVPPVNSVDFLFGFENANAAMAAAPQPMVEPGLDERLMRSDPIQKHIQDLQRLRIEEQQGMYTRKCDDTDKQPEKIPQVPTGVYPPSNVNKEHVYMILAPASAYPTQVIRPANGPPTQGYYAVQRVAPEAYRDHHQPVYNMITQGAVPPMSMPQHKGGGHTDMVRPGTTGGVGMVAYNNGAGRQMVYSAAGGVMGPPAQYQGMGVDMKPAAEVGGKAAAKATQASV
ncbi:hypothetical protein AAHA92_21211 [Salvia divinorum]|uniref:PB1 domain-containing protein n=1 Tax=Salvia divinorum TaxID=28513 RepID=A0ABD1GMH3_SALDI